jgi:hypothetical protein
MAHFYITTQTLENYGAHCDSGRFAAGEHYWKFKGGTDYIISGLDREQDAVAFVAAVCMENGIGYKEFPCHWEEVTADFQTEFEKSQMEYDGEIAYPAQRIDVPEYMASSRRKAQ